MDKNISEIFDYGDEIVVVEEQENPLDPARIKELTMKKIDNDIFREEVGKSVKKARPVYRTVLIAAIVAVLLVGTALAVAVSSGFLQSVFGAKGQENTAPQEVLEAGKDTTWTMPGREWVEVDEEQAEELVGEHIAAVGESISVGNWTLTVDAYTIDDHGIGAVTYTLANPTGFGDAIRDAGNGNYYIAGDNADGLREIGLDGEAPGSPYLMFDSKNIVDNTLTTDTELHAVMYFAPFHRFEAGEVIHMSLFRMLVDENYEEIESEEQIITFTPDSFIPSVALSCPEGYTAHISPLGITFDAAFEALVPTALKALSVQLADGTEYAVKSDDPYMDNCVVACESFDNSFEGVVFNRLVDADSVVSVTLNGPNNTTCIFTPVE